MHIAVDGGGLCAPQDSHFGTYIFSSNLLQALQEHDRKNTYSVYTFCNPTEKFFSHNFKFKYLFPKIGWMKIRVTIEELTSKKDVFLGLNQALPLFSSAKKIAFSHGLSYHYFPHAYKKESKRLTKQRDTYMNRADKIVVSSQRVKDELMQLHQRAEDDIIVLPFGIPYDFDSYNVQSRESFLLYVGMNHPIKNVEFLIKAFQQFKKQKQYKDFKLCLVGPFAEYEGMPDIEVVTNISRRGLKYLYQKASAYITASLYESFNLPVLEALSQNCPVIALESAIIPEFKDFVSIAQHEEDFVELLTALKHKETDWNKLYRTFSWKSYVETLINIYN